MPLDTSPVPLVSRAALRPLTGNVTDMSLSRWMRAGKFPKPVGVLGGQRHWRAPEVAAWQNGCRDWRDSPDPSAAARSERAKHLIDMLHKRHAARRAEKERASPLVAA